ncbi:glycosyl hydrolase family 92-domain-containing protein [Aspergillus flavus]|uniref:Glycosyl hydrolase family 92-domain-containing protein n=1 Tax=Aspergillus flavus TaxID=5059 RepID=A0A5N6GPL6_ASPFL|nr:glycosyl hydrolase family 92-domain-containing protein [Aspergillus flavus]
MASSVLWSILIATPLALGYTNPRSISIPEDYDVLQYVDPLIGSSNGGNVFAGASLPYGMAKAVADTDSVNNQGGFAYDGSNITGFSSLHDSGTGGQPSLGNFPIFPYVSCKDDDVNGCVYPKKLRKTRYDPGSVSASPGYFALTMASGIQVDMTVSHHASLFRFRFPADRETKPLILLDLSDLSDTRQDNGTIDVDADTGRMVGHARFLPSFGSGSYTPYFCIDFRSVSGVRDNGIFVNSRASTDVKNLTISRSINGYPLPVCSGTEPGGAFVRFNSLADRTVLARVGLSFISSEQACSNAESEIPNFDFNATHSAAVDSWTKKLAPIRVSRNGVNSSFLSTFYSGIYRTMINPQDYTGENPLWKSTEPYFDSFYWYAHHLSVEIFSDINIWAGFQTAACRSAKVRNCSPIIRSGLTGLGYTQGGSNADVVLADAYLKGISDGIDWQAGYSAVQKDAEEEPYDWSNEGRGGLDSWKSLNYIPVEDFDYKGFGTMTRSISRTLEYSYDDFTIAQMARGLGKMDDAEQYEATSRFWQNLFRDDQASFINGTDTGFKGFFQPKYLNGTWGYQDPITCSNIDTSGRACSLQNNAAETFEDSIWEYQFFVPHDMAALITRLGGPSQFIRRLDYLHDTGITYIGNEPSFLTVFQYHYGSRPGKSTSRAHFYVPKYFNANPTGLPGNDDSGAMGSFVAMTMMGLFPNPGQNVYLISAPFFESVRIASPLTGRTATIRAVNFDPEYKNIYIQSATLDGKPYSKNWVGHDFFTEGRELVLVLGRNESHWGTGKEDLPPSLSTRGALFD